MEPTQPLAFTVAMVTSAKKAHEGGLVDGFQVKALHCDVPGAQHCVMLGGQVVVRVHGWPNTALAWQTALLVWNCVQQ